MWPVIALLAAAVLFLAGCNTVKYPGDGRLVIVAVDSNIEQCRVGNTTVGAAVRSAIRYWDAAGARLRTMDQLLPSEQQEALSAPRLRVRGDDCSLLGTQLGNDYDFALYHDEGDIELLLRHWPVNTRWTVQTSLIAHEFGHAIGLQHITDEDAIMCASTAERTDLAPGDYREHARVWP